jgi:N-acetylglucosaminyldiphosphoundecaprenol N-acetyl-beta-D-mannosaminyltransferase
MAAPPPLPATVDVLGVPLALTDYERTLDWMDGLVAARGRGYVCCAATHTVMLCREDPEVREAVLGSSFTVPDGQPLVWAINALGHHLPERVYGPTLMARHCERSRSTGVSAYLYGGRTPERLELLERRLGERFAGLRIAGRHSPPHRELDEVELDAVAEEINGSGADVVWVGIGVPKQEMWMARMRDRLEAPVLVGVGAAFDFHAGLVPQAPPALQRLGLEWAYRTAQEPRRLWRRYLKYNPLFAAAFARQYARGWRRRRARLTA